MKDTPEYKSIKTVYGNDIAHRSRLPLMNHIDEGLVILDNLGASKMTKRAWCLHPIIQSDIYFTGVTEDQGWHYLAVMFATEYRNVANACLSTTEDKKYELSILKEVNQMLVADKIQNQKDFRLYNSDHKDAKELEKYFSNWLEALNITPEEARDLQVSKMFQWETCEKRAKYGAHVCRLPGLHLVAYKDIGWEALQELSAGIRSIAENEPPYEEDLEKAKRDAEEWYLYKYLKSREREKLFKKHAIKHYRYRKSDELEEIKEQLAALTERVTKL